MKSTNKVRVFSLEDAVRLVRERHPNAWIEGSTKMEYSFWIDKRTIVATTWKARGKSTWWWLAFETQIV